MRHCTGTNLSDGNHTDLQVTRLNAAGRSSTVDYHNSLLDQARQQHESEQPQRPHTHQCHPTQNHSLGSIRQWLPLSNIKRQRTSGTSDNTGRGCNKKAKNEKDHNNRELASPPHPHLTKRDIEEFEALPVAIRRKYFSTLERLRLAQTSGILDPPSDAFRHHKFRGASLSGAAPGKPLERPTTAPSHRGHAASVDLAFLARLPAKVREKHLSREEQVVIAKRLRQSVILDAADEACLKAGRLANRHPTPPLHSPTLYSSARPSMESLASDNGSLKAHDALYDSFRWLDEDEELDLRLALDDYHVNLRESVPIPPKESRPPSFRRHLSFSKIPFGRPSISSSRPATKDAAPPTAPSAAPSPVAYLPPVRRKSRALSLITPKHAAHESISSIDPGAAHYQDPEARLKLRVYLASPQKFDEAIEFGFPSNDPSSAGAYRDLPSAKDQSRLMFSPDSEKFKTFLSDDRSSTYSEDASLPDPESPRTPNTLDKHVKPLQLPATDDYSSRPSEGYAQVPAASREMTLRMTLTRPDLRACEDQIYGWQKGSRQYSSKPAQILALQDELPTSTTTTYVRDSPKDSIEKIFADIDQELGPPTSTDNNVMKRIWNRVRRG
ncbi:uncharacterized protein F4807DRAFT_468058 [Annulohypoxylon truncatum]|uniref:uncharacterized protein n=1 Tax=Annulohypoxylon truncatum TaxID=327061 RepID=UPI00200739B1|nr:uncharacterized protein F4807DRAFT_468058 [Annulohypoxylon truncatum]KAI1214043.1 hypothetical protein F4807DRAFT_468058 [Annulohypoxylon truncatum]